MRSVIANALRFMGATRSDPRPAAVGAAAAAATDPFGNSVREDQATRI
jgi:hypothetical protein